MHAGPMHYKWPCPITAALTRRQQGGFGFLEEKKSGGISLELFFSPFSLLVGLFYRDDNKREVKRKRARKIDEELFSLDKEPNWAGSDRQFDELAIPILCFIGLVHTPISFCIERVVTLLHGNR